MQVALDDAGETIKAVRFTGDGCAISMASASMLSERLHGMSIEELDALDTDDITEMLGVDISPMRVKCAVLGRQVAQDGSKIHRDELDPDDRTKTEE